MSLELRKGKKGFAEQKTVARYCPSSLQGFSLHSAQGKGRERLRCHGQLWHRQRQPGLLPLISGD